MGDLSRKSLLIPFGIPPETSRLVRIAQGFINETYAVETAEGKSYILQQINPSVFSNFEGIMQNIQRALPLLKAPDYEPLELIPTLEGKPLFTDTEGSPWRVFRYISNSYSVDATDNPEMAAEAGRIIGRFHQLVSKADPAEFIHVLPRFHDLEYRVGQLRDACQVADKDRRQKAADVLEISESLIAQCRLLPLSDMPVRLCHNDTKLSNILFDINDNRALCLIDLDTLMPGLLLYDTGDALRTLLNPLPEDHPNPGEFRFEAGLFPAFLEGLKESNLQMTREERESLPYSTAYMSLLHGIRALSDYLQGDLYYRVRYPEANLARATNLFQTSGKVLESFEALDSIRKKILG